MIGSLHNDRVIKCSRLIYYFSFQCALNKSALAKSKLALDPRDLIGIVHRYMKDTKAEDKHE